MESSDATAVRAETRARWERAAGGWERRADRVRELTMPVAAWMIEHLALQPGQRVLELAAGPGDTGFLAAELIAPGGILFTSDGAESMLTVARARAEKLGVENVEFLQLELEWIDLPTASVDAVLCRWGLMLAVDPSSALSEARRVLRPGGRIALAVWDLPEHNPWATIPTQVLVQLGHSSPPDPSAPGMFALAAPGRLQALLDSAGFLEVVVDQVAIERPFGGPEEYLAETLDLSRPFAELFGSLSEDARDRVTQTIAAKLEPFVQDEGGLLLPGVSLVAAAVA